MQNAKVNLIMTNNVSKQTNKARKDISKEKCIINLDCEFTVVGFATNPIFLFQRGTLKIPSKQNKDNKAIVEYNHDLDEMVGLDDAYISDHKTLDEEHGYMQWSTEHAWATREEAEEWGKNHAHRYKVLNEKGVLCNGWRIYCVPCCGSLAALLDDSDPQDSLEWGEKIQ